MAKTKSPQTVRLGKDEFRTNAKPDTYDVRDLEYRPMLRPLPPVVDARPKNNEFRVLKQDGESCTGHAIAAVINTVLSRQATELELPKAELVSPYMLYRLARRYDEFLGEDDEGSSLRGAFKGWLRHGVALESQWEQLAIAEGSTAVDALPDLDNPAFIAACRQRPLGAYYRVNPYRLDDMQSAINELHAIAVSAAVHEGWKNPILVTEPGGRHKSAMIRRDKPAEQIGGHAFCIVGYNEIGFLVQNSWGEDWGKGGFATLLYDDWLASAFDAWVCRPGVPSTPIAAPSVASRVTTAGDVVLSGGPNMTVLRNYVVNTGNNGFLSKTGKFTSTPAQLDEIFVNMTAKHDVWTKLDKTTDRHILLYAHGGLIDEFNGLGIAQHQLGWWLNSHVYPISFCWESGAVETIGDAVADLVRKHTPFGIGFDLEEQGDRLVEFFARKFASGLWQEMKENAIGASAPEGKDKLRGGTQIGLRILKYQADHPEAKVRVHLAGHSAGTIFLSALVQRLTEMNITIESVAFMGGAATNEQVVEQVVPAFRERPGGRGIVRRFTTFDLFEKNEQDDSCPLGDKVFYHKSLLYLVARALERNPDRRTGMVPLVGLELALEKTDAKGASLQSLIEATDDACDGIVVLCPTKPPSPGEPVDPTALRSDARGHGAFDNDSETMTSIMRRMPGVSLRAGPYRPDMSIDDLPLTPAGIAPAGMETHVLVSAANPVKAAPLIVPATAASAAGAEVVADATEAAFGVAVPMGALAASAPGAAVLAMPEIRIPSEAAIAPQTGSPAFDILKASGYSWDNAPVKGRKSRGGNGKG